MNLNRLKRWHWGAGAFVSAVVLLVACDGQNLFDASSNPFIDPRVTISVPDGAFAGDTLGISISASAANNLATIQVSVRGAANKDTTITVSGRTVSTVVRVPLPSILTDTLIFVSAIATDVNGNVSKVRADTATVLGPPAVISVSGPDSLRLGGTATLRVRAFGTRRIAQIDLTLRGAINKDTTIFVVPPVNDVTQNITFNVPTSVADTSLRVGVTVKDITGLSGRPVSLVVPVSVTAPAISLTAPATAAPGGTLDLHVVASSMRQVKAIRIVTTGALTKDTTVTLIASSTNVVQDIAVRLPGDVPSGTITVRAYAIDNAGVFSSPSAPVVVTVNASAPVVVSVTGPDSVRAGGVVDIRVVARGTRPITELNIRFRGATNQDIKVPITTPSVDVSKDVSITLPADVSDTLLTVTAVATDQGGALSAITSASTKVIRVKDTTAPVVSTTVNPGSTSAGSIVSIRVNARDNVGLSRIGFAVVNPAGDTIGTTPTLVNTSGAVKDTVFSFLVPSTITPRTVRVLGIGVDASGRRGFSTPVSVIVADSAAPTITIIAPAPGSTLPLNDSVRVQVRVQDATGIKSITLRGESVRVDSLGPTRTIQRFSQKTITFPFNPGAPLPRDTTIIRYLNAIADSISEPVSIIVTAADSLNNTASATTSILVGGPRVELRNPANNTQVVPGGTLLLTAFAVDRSAGIDSVKITLTGAQQATFIFKSGCLAATCPPNGLVSNDSVLINQNYVVGAATGVVTITASAWNRNRVAGQSAPVTVLVSTNAVTDASPPQVRVAMTANDRIELTDTITLTVAAQDVGAAGLRRIGIVAIVTPGGTGVAPDTLYRDSVFTGSGRTGLQPATFKFTLKDFGYTEVNLVRLPRTMTFNVHAFAVDTIGNSGCNVTNTLATLPCDSILPPLVPAGQKWFVAKNTAGLSQLVTVVPGFARALPSQGSVIADLVVDNNPARPRMYLANQNFNRVEVLNLQDSTFAPAVSVGSEPWGMTLNNPAVGIGAGAPRLLVANSGGTNISQVDITQPVNAIAEVPSERILTPNAVLFDVITATDNGKIRYTTAGHDFSDRPQFIGEDANGIILYSTKPTGAAPDGTVRYLLNTAPRRESKILFNRNAIISSTDATAIAHVDSIIVQRNSTIDDNVNIFDHVAGNPAMVIQSGFRPLQTAITTVRGLGSDIVDFGGTWNLAVVGLSDTTFVTTSGDRNFVGFGEGGTGPFARVWLWSAATQGISDDVSVTDLVGNSAERVLGIALNLNGTIGGARGANAAYFFSNDANFEGILRLQGVFSNGVAGGNGGIALHPNHNLALGSNSTTLAFVATVNRSIKIVDTFSFRERGEIQIRDNIVGQLRAALPLAAENVGLVECDQIWVKLYGVTGAGKAVIINVRKKDVINPTITAAVCPS